MRQGTRIFGERAVGVLGACLAWLGIWLAVTGPASAAQHGRYRKPALRPIAGTTLTPHWACPERACDAIVLPRPVPAPGGHAQLGSTSVYPDTGELGGLDPQEIQSAYAIPSTLSLPQTIAVVDYGGYPNAEADLASYREHYGLAPCTKANGCFHKVNQAGVEGEYPAEEPGWDQEAALDVDMAAAACPQCHIMMVETSAAPAESPEEIADFAAAENTAARLGATEISNSYGFVENDEKSCGPAHCTQYAADYEHPGVVIAAASGDQGYEDVYFDLGYRSSSFPATVPAVIAVGGTALNKSAGPRGWSETVWNDPPQQGEELTEGVGTGSGCALDEPKPSWQTDAGCAHRTDSDVAAVASPVTPVSFYVDGEWSLAGGTSASAPIVAGIDAHASAYVRSLGPRAFYEDPGALYDITEGFNWNWDGQGKRPTSECAPDEYLCNAEVGYDGPTGMGTPDGVPEITEPADSHWYSNGTLIASGLRETVKAKGSLTFHLSESVGVKCKVKDDNQIENPTGGATGVDSLSDFVLSGCKATGSVCAKGEKLLAVPGGLPWSSTLIAGSPVRDQLASVEVRIECKAKIGATKSYDTLTGILQPEVATNLLTYTGASGELSQTLPGKATVTGEEKLTAPKKAEITAATP